MDKDRPGVAVVGCVLMALLGIAQMIGCYALLEDHWGWPRLLAIVAMIILMMARAGMLVAIGCFFGALLVWRWPWWGALLLAAPGIAFFGLSTLGIMGTVGIDQLRAASTQATDQNRRGNPS